MSALSQAQQKSLLMIIVDCLFLNAEHVEHAVAQRAVELNGRAKRFRFSQFDS